MVEVMKKVSENYEENVKAARKIFPRALVFDVTAVGAMKKLDPGCPVGRVEIPGRERMKALSLQGVWEGLKVFKKNDEIDEKWMTDERKIGRKRGFKNWGEMIGIRVNGELMREEEGRKMMREIYEKMIRERFGRILDGIRREAERKTVVLLDYKEENKDRVFNHTEVLKEMLTPN